MSAMPDFAPAEEEELTPVSAIASIESESTLLGGLLLDNGGWDRVGDILVAEDFYRAQHRLIFAALASLINACKPADIITVLDQLRRTGHEAEAGGLDYLQALTQYLPSMSAMRRHAETVREFALRRKLAGASDDIRKLAMDRSGRFDEVLEKATGLVTGLMASTVDDDWEGADSGMVKLLDRISDQASGTFEPDFTPTGLTALDARMDGGMRGGELIVIGARPSMGKSALGLTIAANVALTQSKPIGFFSMEMPKAQVFARLMSLVSEIHLSRVKRGERLRDDDWPAITSTVERLRQADISINDRQALNIHQVRASARALRRRRGPLGCLVVDYLGLMSGTDPKQSRTYQLEEATKGLKGLAKELDCPVLLLCQLSRGVEGRDDPMPMLSDLRDSGAIEQDADVVLFVHRPIKAKPELGDEWKNYAKASAAKLRDGEPGFLDLWYVGENTRFDNWPVDTPIPTNAVRIRRAEL